MRLDKQYSVVALRVAVFLWFFGPGRFGALFGRALFLLPGASGHRMGLSFRPGTGVLLLFHFTGIGVGCVFVLDLAVLPAADALCFDADFFLCFGFCPEAWARVAEAGVAAGPEPVLDWAEIVREEARNSAADSRMIFDEVFIMAIDLK